MIWVTRAGGNVDRVACPWLIKRFIDKEAQFLFVPAEKVLETAGTLGAKSYDAKGSDYTHQKLPEGEVCSFVTLMRAFHLWGKDPALDEVAKIVNHADVSPETSAYKMPEGDGLEAIARGCALLTDDDHQKLAWEFPLYDALYAYCQKKLRGGS
ncbi:MAG: chromate resistance protein [Planctomycetes bacterium]|nr:chromate resistance protein [Planctomycetota bacterium]